MMKTCGIKLNNTKFQLTFTIQNQIKLEAVRLSGQDSDLQDLVQTLTKLASNELEISLDRECSLRPSPAYFSRPQKPFGFQFLTNDICLLYDFFNKLYQISLIDFEDKMVLFDRCQQLQHEIFVNKLRVGASILSL